MSDVFISYSRRDQAFVRKLFVSLSDARRKPWVDWNEIIPTAQWLQEVYEAVESADSFAFVISPSSLTSKTCQLELQHAIEYKKRIIPLVYHDPKPDQEVSPALAAINWIFFRDQDDYSQAFQQLEFVLDVDIHYWKLSTKLLTRALQWEKQHHDRGLTLRGSELLEAEKWATQGVNIKPAPTSLHIQYITASRRETSQRQRITISFLSVAASALLILSIATYSLYQNANYQRQVAIQQRNTALARALALESTVALGQDSTDVALLLADEATKIDATTQTRDALLDALVDSPHLNTLYYAPDNSVTQAVLSPDGKTIYGIGSHLYAWNMTDNISTPRTLLAASDLSEARPPSIAQVVVSHNGQLLAVIADENFSVVQAATGKIVWKIAPPDMDGTYSVDGLAFNSDDSRLTLIYNIITASQNGSVVTNSSYTHVQQYNAQTGAAVGNGFNLDNGVAVLALSRDDSLLFTDNCPITECAQSVQEWSMPQDQLIASLPISTIGMNSVALNANNTLLALATCSQSPQTITQRCNQGVIQIWSLISHRLLESTLITNAFGSATDLAFSPNNQYLVASLGLGTCSGSNCNAGQMQLWSLSKGMQLIGEPFAGHFNRLNSIQFLPDGRHALSASNGLIDIWNIGGYDPISPFIIDPDPQHAIADSNLAYGSSDTSLSMRNGHDLYTWNPFAASMFTGFPLQGDQFVAIAPGARFAVECENSILIWNIVSQSVIHTLKDSQDTQPCQNAAFSADGAYLAVAYNSPDGSSPLHVVVWNTNTWQIVRHISAPGDLYPQVALNSDGSTLVVLSDGTTFSLWNLKTGAAIGSPIKLAQQSPTFALSPDGKTIAFFRNGLALMDVRTLKVIATMPAPLGQSGYDVLAFSPDGQYIAEMGYYALTIWDAQQHTDFVDFPHVGSQTDGAIFSPDGRYLTWDSDDGIIITRSLALSDWQAAACAITHRNLSKSEWSLYVQGLPYVRICPNWPLA